MSESESLPQVFAKIERKILIDHQLREETGNQQDIYTSLVKSLKGRPRYGYLDEVSASVEQKEELVGLVESLTELVTINGQPFADGHPVKDVYEADERVNLSSLLTLNTGSFRIDYGEELEEDNPFLSIDTKSETNNLDFSFTATFDRQKYYLDIEFLDDQSKDIPSYFVYRSINKITGEDFEMSKFILESAKNELENQVS